MNKPNIFLTGSTGLLGSYLLKILLHNNHKVYCLARSKDNKSAEERVKDILNFWDKKVLERHSKNLIVLEGDITKGSLGLTKKDIEILKEEINEIFHCAAVTQFNWPLDKIRKVNTEGTKNILDLALKCNNLKKVNHISTAYVCGDYKGVFKETDLDKGQKFNTTYEQSKFEAEKLVNKYREKGLWVDVFRPPLIIGESTTGKISVIQGFYQTLHYWRSEIFDVFPGKDIKINIVPVDLFCKSIITIASFTRAKNKVYHPFGPPTALKNVINIAAKYGKFKKPRLVSVEEFRNTNLTVVQRMILKDNILDYNPDIILDSKFTAKILSKHGLSLPPLKQSTLTKIISYPYKSGFKL